MKNIFTNKLGIARSIIAFALLTTLLTSDKDVLFIEGMTLPESATFLQQINLFYLFDYESLHFSYLIAILILSLVIVGIYPRLTGILHWWVTISFFTSSIIIEGGDQIALIFTFFLLPITLLDERKNHYYPPVLISQWKKNVSDGLWFILKVQAAILYLEAGIGKVYLSTEWADGTAMYYWLNHNIFGRGDYLVTIMNDLMASPSLTYILSHSIIILELTIFGAFFSNSQKFKNIVFGIAIIFHFSIVIYFGLFSFFLNMVGVLIIYLLDLKSSFRFSFKQIALPKWFENNLQLSKT